MSDAQEEPDKPENVYRFDEMKPPRTLKLCKPADLFKSRRPPDYLVDGVIATGRLYSMTGFTGHGKSMVALDIALSVSEGVEWNGHECERGQVVILAGENPENLEDQLYAAAFHKGLKLDGLNIQIIENRFSIEEKLDELVDQLEAIEGLRLIVVDTLQAFAVEGQDSDNDAAIKSALQFRTLTLIKQRPAVLVPCHPSGKKEDKANLVPRGGGAFLNEVDGNFSLFKSGDRLKFFTQGKLRNAPFDPMHWHVGQVEFPELPDAKGRPANMPMITPITQGQMDGARDAEREEHAAVLRHINENPKTSVAKIGDAIGKDKSAAQRIVKKLKDERLIELRAGLWQVLPDGRKWLETYGEGGANDPF